MTSESYAKFMALAKQMFVELHSDPHRIPDPLRVLAAHSTPRPGTLYERRAELDAQRCLLYGGLAVLTATQTQGMASEPRLSAGWLESPVFRRRYAEADGPLGRTYKLLWTLQNTAEDVADEMPDKLRSYDGFHAVRCEVDRILADYRELRPHPRYRDSVAMMKAGSTTMARHLAFSGEALPYALLDSGDLTPADLALDRRERTLSILERSFAASPFLVEPARGSSLRLSMTLRSLVDCATAEGGISHTPASMPGESSFFDREDFEESHHSQLPYDIELMQVSHRGDLPVLASSAELERRTDCRVAEELSNRARQAPQVYVEDAIGCPGLHGGLIRRNVELVGRMNRASVLWGHQLDVAAYELTAGRERGPHAMRGRSNPTRREIADALDEVAKVPSPTPPGRGRRQRRSAGSARRQGGITPPTRMIW